MVIPKSVTETSSETVIPQNVAELPQKLEAPESEPYVISFARYNNRLCEISILGKNRGNKALTILKEIGTKVFSRVDFQKNGIKTDGIGKDGEYKLLYHGLEPDYRSKGIIFTGRWSYILF